MARSSNPDPEVIHAQQPCLGIVLTNLGTPDAPHTAAVRRYLAEFLSDPRVIELPRWLWLPVLHGIVLRTRPRRSAHAYAKIWEEQGSPLLSIGQMQKDGLQSALASTLPGPVRVELAMRYGNPGIPAALDALHQAGARRLLVLPLYPQYSATTTASTFDAVTRALQGWRWVPELRFITHYHDNEGYIRALAESVRAHWHEHGRGDRLLMSFHGIPRHYFLAGDPYYCQCMKTARLLAEALDLPEEAWQASFQSRFGAARWLEPYTDATLEAWGRQGVHRVDLICPGFAADCLETLEEIRMQNRDFFLEAGGREFHYIPALNDSPRHIELLAALARRHSAGWPEAETGAEPSAHKPGHA